MLKYSRIASKIVALIIKTIREEIKPGLTGKDLEKIAVSIMNKNGAKSSSFGYGGFPGSICVSINDELTHGVPDDRCFSFGDLISVDVACSYKGFHGDAAVTILLEDPLLVEGDFYDKKRKLIEVTESSLNEVIKKIIPGKTTTRDLGSIIQNYVEKENCFVIKEYGGHGIGRRLHMDPFIPNYKINYEGDLIKPGMIICIEPLVQYGNDKIKIASNGNTIVSSNGFLNAHFEHTILIGSKSVEILTLSI
ncbi:MAG: Methionine aminopeptidase 1 [Mycoplasmataceae bacterium]|nr:MAG: Methionine aminopeptidase 1 [Mycoplasmataceae bacterium]